MNQIPQVRFGLPGGSGTWGCLFPEDLHRPEAVVLEYYPKGFETPYGQSAPSKLLRIGESHALQFAMHGWHPDRHESTGVCAMQVAWCFYQAGVETVLVAASVGGIQKPDQPGQPLAPWSVGPTTGLISPWVERTPGQIFREGTRYPRMAQVTCPPLRTALVEAAKKQQMLTVYNHGIYAGTDGRLETEDEICVFRAMRANVVGQTFQHEHPLWRRLGLHVGHLWIVSNFAETGGTWIESAEYKPEDWDDFYQRCAVPCANVLVDTILSLGNREPTGCRCREFAMAKMSQFPVDVPERWPKPRATL